MAKLKTNRAAAKRFKRTKSGEIKRHHAFTNHLKSSKSAKRRRNLRQSAILAKEDLRTVKRMVPYI